MEPETVVGAREDAHADFGREEESPRVVVLLDDVVIGRKFGVVGTQLQARIRLEYAVRKPGVTAGDAERQLEYGVLLVDREGRTVAQVECLARDRFEVGLVGDERADGDGRGDEVAAFEIHAPARGFVGQAAAQGHAYLPVDVDVAVREDLCFARARGGEQDDTECDGF